MEDRLLNIYLRDSDAFDFLRNYIEDYQRRKELFNRMEGVNLPNIVLNQIYRDDLPELLETREKIVFVGKTIPEELAKATPEIIYQGEGVQIKKYFSFFIQIDIDEKIAHHKDEYYRFLEKVARAQMGPGINSDQYIAKVHLSEKGLAITGMKERRILSRGFGQKAFMYGIVPFGFVLDAPMEKADDQYAKTQEIKYGLYLLEKKCLLEFLEIELPKAEL